MSILSFYMGFGAHVEQWSYEALETYLEVCRAAAFCVRVFSIIVVIEVTFISSRFWWHKLINYSITTYARLASSPSVSQSLTGNLDESTWPAKLSVEAQSRAHQ